MVEIFRIVVMLSCIAIYAVGCVTCVVLFNKWLYHRFHSVPPKEAEVVLSHNVSDGGCTMCQKSVHSKKEFLEVAAEFWDNHGTGFNDYDQFLVKFENTIKTKGESNE